MNIQGLGDVQHIAQMLRNTGVGGAATIPGGFHQGEPPSQVASIRSDQGQSLLDIRADLQSAVKDAMQSYDGSGDFHSTVEGVLHTTLEEHGFDPEEVKNAMQDSGFHRMHAMASEGRNPMATMFGGGAYGFDPSSILQDGGSEEDLIQAFLQQFRAGVNLDLEI